MVGLLSTLEYMLRCHGASNVKGRCLMRRPLAQVVRCFEVENVIHVAGKVDPVEAPGAQGTQTVRGA